VSQLVWRSIDAWPGTLTRHRVGSTFSAPLDKSYALLRNEVDRIAKPVRNGVGGRFTEVVVQQAYDESDLKVDGSPKIRAVLRHPGVIVSFDSKHGPLRYWTDVFVNWSDNLRAIALALGLEALRKLDRYGIAARGEQYTGWKAIGSGIAMGPGMTIEYAAWLLGLVLDEVDDPTLVNAAYRRLAAKHHPDVGGNPGEFRRITAARDLLESR
jgi:hypothetical protein